MEKNFIPRLIAILNALDLLGISFVIFLSFCFQFIWHELPCPLCLMQRLGILAIGFGFLLNIHCKVRPIHYTLTMLAAFFTAAVATRQILLHIVPGTGGYGSAIFGLHMYTWTFLMSVAVIILMSIRLSIPSQYFYPIRSDKSLKVLAHISFLFFITMLVANIISTYMECGLTACPANPVSYKI